VSERERISQAEYRNNPTRCPLCESEDIIRTEHTLRTFTLGIVHQRVECAHCGAEWEEKLKVIGYTNLDSGHLDLLTIRKQLKLMDDFMSKTPSHDSTWWDANMPAYPDEYSPREWQSNGRNTPIFLVWEKYLDKLRYEKFFAYRSRAENLPVHDLLTASRREYAG